MTSSNYGHIMTVIKGSDPAELNQTKRRLMDIDGAGSYTESWSEPMVLLNWRIDVDVIDRIREETPLTPKRIEVNRPEGERIDLIVEMGDPFDCEECDHVADDYREGVGWLCDYCDKIHWWMDKMDDVDREFVEREYMHADEWDRDVPEPGAE